MKLAESCAIDTSRRYWRESNRRTSEWELLSDAAALIVRCVRGWSAQRAQKEKVTHDAEVIPTTYLEDATSACLVMAAAAAMARVTELPNMTIDYHSWVRCSPPPSLCASKESFPQLDWPLIVMMILLLLIFADARGGNHFPIFSWRASSCLTMGQMRASANIIRCFMCFTPLVDLHDCLALEPVFTYLVIERTRPTKSKRTFWLVHPPCLSWPSGWWRNVTRDT